MKNVSKFLQEIKIYDCNLTKTRIGNKHDGGYVALRELCETTDAVYSFGIEKDVGFELDFVNRFRKAEVKLFDHTIDSLPYEHKNFAFWKLGVGTEHASLKDIVNIVTGDMGHLLLKMDIEWDEWHTLLSTDIKTLSRFSQLLIEFHIVGIDTTLQVERSRFVRPHYILTPYFKNFYEATYDKINDNIFKTYYQVMKKLNEHFYMFHIHANNSLSKIGVNGHSLPPLVELSFVRKDLVGGAEKTKESFPVEGLDFPNKTDRPDIINFYPLGS